MEKEEANKYRRKKNVLKTEVLRAGFLHPRVFRIVPVTVRAMPPSLVNEKISFLYAIDHLKLIYPQHFMFVAYPVRVYGV